MPKKFFTMAVLITIFLTGFLIVQPASSATGQTQLYLDLRVCPAVMRYHATTLEANLMQKGWTQGNIWCPRNYSVPVAGVAVQFFLVARGGLQTLIGANATDAAGVSHLYYVPTAQPGQYWIRAQVAGINSTASDQEIFQILSDPVAITVPPLSTIWGVNYTVPIRVTTPCGYPIPNLQLAVSTFAGGQCISLGNATTDGNGRASVTALMSFAPGYYDLQIAFQGLQKGHFWEYLILTLLGMNPDCLGNYIFPGALEILPRATTLVAFNATMDYKDPALLVANLTDSLGLPVLGGNVTFSVNTGSTWQPAGSILTDYNGIASLTYISPLYPGTYDIASEFGGNTFYLPSSGFGQLTVGPDPTVINVPIEALSGRYSDASSITANLTDDDFTDLLAGATLTFSLNISNTWVNIGTAITDADGNAQLSFAPYLLPGAYCLKVVFVGNATYQPTVNYFWYDVEKDFIAITVPNNQVNYGDHVLLTGTLNDDAGRPISGSILTFFVQNDGSWLSIGSGVTDNTGVATCDYVANNISPGTHSIKVQFDGDAYYFSGWSTDHLTVTNLNVLSFPTPPVLIIKRGDPYIINIHLQDSLGNAQAGVQVEITSYVTTSDSDQFAVTDASGDASVTLDLAGLALAPAEDYFIEVIIGELAAAKLVHDLSYKLRDEGHHFLGVGIGTFLTPGLYKDMPSNVNTILAIRDMFNSFVPALSPVALTNIDETDYNTIVNKYNSLLPDVFAIESHGDSSQLVTYNTYGGYPLIDGTELSGAKNTRFAFLGACASYNVGQTMMKKWGTMAVISYKDCPKEYQCSDFDYDFFLSATTLGDTIETAYVLAYAAEVAAYAWVDNPVNYGLVWVAVETWRGANGGAYPSNDVVAGIIGVIGFGVIPAFTVRAAAEYWLSIYSEHPITLVLPRLDGNGALTLTSWS